MPTETFQFSFKILYFQKQKSIVTSFSGEKKGYNFTLEHYSSNFVWEQLIIEVIFFKTTFGGGQFNCCGIIAFVIIYNRLTCDWIGTASTNHGLDHQPILVLLPRSPTQYPLALARTSTTLLNTTGAHFLMISKNIYLKLQNNLKNVFFQISSRQKISFRYLRATSFLHGSSFHPQRLH